MKMSPLTYMYFFLKRQPKNKTRQTLYASQKRKKSMGK